jgi:predicted RNA-binding protein associated with RNAse of E/G family
MNPAMLLLIIQGVQAAIAAAPQVVDLVVKAKDFIASLFSAGLITKEQQDRIHAHVDAVCAAALAGQELPEWTVEPDPGVA